MSLFNQKTDPIVTAQQAADGAYGLFTVAMIRLEAANKTLATEQAKSTAAIAFHEERHTLAGDEITANAEVIEKLRELTA